MFLFSNEGEGGEKAACIRLTGSPPLYTWQQQTVKAEIKRKHTYKLVQPLKNKYCLWFYKTTCVWWPFSGWLPSWLPSMCMCAYLYFFYLLLFLFFLRPFVPLSFPSISSFPMSWHVPVTGGRFRLRCNKKKRHPPRIHQHVNEGVSGDDCISNAY